MLWMLLVLSSLLVAVLPGLVRSERLLPRGRAIRSRRRALRRERERLLLEAGIDARCVNEVHDIAGIVLEADPDLHRRYDVEGLLDRYVAYVVERGRCSRALIYGSYAPLFQEREAERVAGRIRRVEMIDRRVRVAEACEARAAWLDEELLLLVHLLQLLATSAILGGAGVIEDAGCMQARFDLIDAEQLAAEAVIDPETADDEAPVVEDRTPVLSRLGDPANDLTSK